MTTGHEVGALLATIDAGASGFTLCRVGAGIRLVGDAYDGVSALQVLAGTMRLILPAGEHRIVRAGQLALIPGGIRPAMAPDSEPSPLAVDGRTCLVRRDGWLTADATRGREAALVVAAARITGTNRRSLTEPLVAHLPEQPEGRQALTMLRREVARAAPGSTTLAVTLMSLCIVVGLRGALAASDQERGAGRVEDRRGAVDRALAAVRARPADPHSIDTLARAAGMSRSTLVRHFREVLRMTPGAFILRARLTEAASLLRTGDASVKAVAAATGFASRSHFSRAFAAHFGADPSTWRGPERTNEDQIAAETGASAIQSRDLTDQQSRLTS